MTTYETVRELARELPNVEESTSYGTPALKVKKKLMVRLKEDGKTIVLLVGFDQREILMQIDPETFFITDHYRGYPSVLAKLPRLSRKQLRDVLGMAYQFVVGRASARRSSKGPG
jgi:hypothetical protein